MAKCFLTSTEAQALGLPSVDEQIERYNRLVREARKLDCVEPSIPGPSDCTDEFRRGWLAGLNAAFEQAAAFRKEVA
jgi:hypothetical protein